MKKTTFQLKNYVIATGIFIASVVVGILIFFTCVQQSVEINSRSIMMTDISRQSEHLRSILNIHYQYLNEIAFVLGEAEELLSQENLDRLVTVHEKTELERIALIDEEGNAYYDNGMVKNVAHRKYFQDALEGMQTISDPLESSVDQEIRVVLSVPVYKGDDIIGVFGGSFNVSAISRLLFAGLFGGEGNCCIVTSVGELIAFESGDASEEMFDYKTNMFEFYEEKNLKEEDTTLNSLKEEFQEGNAGIVRLDLKERNESDRYLAYVPLGYNDWMICYTVPVETAQEDYEFIRKYELIFMGCFCILVAILVLYTAFRNKEENEKLARSAQMDALTGLYNKENTQKVIDRMLNRKNQQNEKVFSGFMILDMDHFKDINDTFGHAVGDRVLQAFGELLQSQFRDEDVVGRIGGDEFVVLLYDIGSEENMKLRVKDLQQKIKTLDIPELQGHKLTSSAGIAFAPKDGECFMELYRRADNALYQIKHGGRDGYAVYEKLM